MFLVVIFAESIRGFVWLSLDSVSWLSFCSFLFGLLLWFVYNLEIIFFFFFLCFISFCLVREKAEEQKGQRCGFEEFGKFNLISGQIILLELIELIWY